MAEQPATSGAHVSSAGHAMATGDWLDDHFATAQPEYTAMVRAAGFQPGWHVLDAGCGGGAFLPLLADLVGVTGRLAALDLAPENVAAIEARLETWALPCAVEARVGSLTSLPYPDASFDGVWCANVTQYLSDEDLAVALAELRRVVRPGGLVAVKEVDATLARLTTPDPLLLLRNQEVASRDGTVQVRGMMRGPGLRAWLVRAGLVEVWGRSTLIERFAPHPPVERRFLANVYRSYAERAATRDLSPEDLAGWAWLRDHAEDWVDAPGHYYREGHVLTVGRVPGNH